MENEMTEKSDVLNELAKEINSVGVKNISPIKKALWILYCDVDGYEHISIDAMVELTTQAEQIAKLREALKLIANKKNWVNLNGELVWNEFFTEHASDIARDVLAETESQ